MLVVDIYTLLSVYSLNLAQQVLIYSLYAEDSHYIMRIKRSLCNLPAGFDLITNLNVKS